MTSSKNSFDCRQTLTVDGDAYDIFSLDAFAKKAGADLSRLPFSIKVMLENLLRNEDGRFVKADDIKALACRARQRKRNCFCSRARAHAGFHRRARDRRPGRHARRHEEARRLA